jgi:hypothetical protein
LGSFFRGILQQFLSLDQGGFSVEYHGGVLDHGNSDDFHYKMPLVFKVLSKLNQRVPQFSSDYQVAQNG